MEVSDRISDALEARDRSLQAVSQAGDDVGLARAFWCNAGENHRLAKRLMEDAEADGLLEISTARPHRAPAGVQSGMRANFELF